MTKKLVLFGDSVFAEVAYEYFTHDSDYKVVAFTVNKEFITKDSLFGLPVVPFENIEQSFGPADHQMHVALVYNQLNRVRMRVFEEGMKKGYTFANYVSSRAFVWENVTMGTNVFIFEDNTVQPFVRIGSNTVLWSGNHIGHHSTIADHNFISSHVVISGMCNIGSSCFFGVNSTVTNNLSIGKDCLIGAGALIAENLPDGSYVKGNRSLPEKRNMYQKLSIEKS